MQQQAINAGKHTLEIENRARLVATGVERVDFFSGELIALVEQNTPAGFLPLFLHLNDIVLACILFSLVLDTAETLYRTARYGCR